MAINCGCEPVPYHLKDVFPGCKIEYEDPAFYRTQCEWHWEVPCRKAKAKICISGSESLWVVMSKIGLKLLADNGIDFELRQDEGRRVAVRVPIIHAERLGGVLHYRR